MSDDRLAKMEERDRSMRLARDEILRRVGTWLSGVGFQRAGAGHYTRMADDLVWHIGFQKLSSCRSVRIMCHISNRDVSSDSVMGPWSDPYACPNSPNGKKYSFGWSTREVDIAKCAEEYCRYINDVVMQWFKQNASCK